MSSPSLLSVPCHGLDTSQPDGRNRERWFAIEEIRGRLSGLCGSGDYRYGCAGDLAASIDEWRSVLDGKRLLIEGTRKDLEIGPCEDGVEVKLINSEGCFFRICVDAADFVAILDDLA